MIPTEVTFTIGERIIRAVPTSRAWGRMEGMWDLYEADVRLTPADPLWFNGTPTLAAVESVLRPRVQALMKLMAKYKIKACDDYPDLDDDLLAAVEEPYPLPGRYVYVHGDETYHFVGTCTTVQEAVDALGSYIGEEYGGRPVALRDLDTGESIPFESYVRIKAAPGRSPMTYLSDGELVELLQQANAERQARTTAVLLEQIRTTAAAELHPDNTGFGPVVRVVIGTIDYDNGNFLDLGNLAAHWADGECDWELSDEAREAIESTLIEVGSTYGAMGPRAELILDLVAGTVVFEENGRPRRG